MKKGNLKSYNWHYRKDGTASHGICGYWHREAGFGMTTLNANYVTCPRCKYLLKKQGLL